MGNTGGETVQNAIWILIGLAIALIVGWAFEKTQIAAWVVEVWDNLIGWTKSAIRVK